jgi:two-component system, chemotaxis family, protein-glutamate methylesterase/glutaminase
VIGLEPTMPQAERSGLHVLVVDDSAVVRQFMAGLLADQPDMTVATAADPLIALGKMERSRPDVILLDLEMPRMNGIEFLRRVMAEDPIPVVVCSSHTGRGTRAALEALELGAVEVLEKPSVGLRTFLNESAMVLVETLRAAAQVTPRPASRPVPVRRVLPARSPVPVAGGPVPLVAIGASTGGPEALRALFSMLPRDAGAFVVVQHMPAAFTGAFASRLDEISPLTIKQAEDGDSVALGTVLVAPGDRHLRVERRGTELVARLDEAPPVCRHRPSVDVLFHSIARLSGVDTVAALLTGMGKDGAEGLLALRNAGARTVAQDEASSVVFGMPREAIARGAAEVVLPLDRLAQGLLERCYDLRRGFRPASHGART